MFVAQSTVCDDDIDFLVNAPVEMFPHFGPRRGKAEVADTWRALHRRYASMRHEVPFLVAIKLVVHPAIVLVLLSLLGPFSDAWMAAAVLMAALPPALNVFVMARQYDSWVAQASGSVLLGTLASVVTLTAVMWLVKTHGLPL